MPGEDPRWARAPNELPDIKTPVETAAEPATTSNNTDASAEFIAPAADPFISSDAPPPQDIGADGLSP